MNTLTVELVKDHVNGNSSWFQGMTGKRFTVVQDLNYKAYYFVVENGVRTSKMIPARNCIVVHDDIMAVKVCPKCHREYRGAPAKSRIDNSEICPHCGYMEGIDAALAAGAISMEDYNELKAIFNKEENINAANLS